MGDIHHGCESHARDFLGRLFMPTVWGSPARRQPPPHEAPAVLFSRSRPGADASAPVPGRPERKTGAIDIARVRTRLASLVTMGPAFRAALGGLWWEVLTGTRLGTANLLMIVAEPIGVMLATRWRPSAASGRAGLDAGSGDPMNALDGEEAEAASRDQPPRATGDQPYLWLPVLVAIGLLFFLVGPLGREIREPIDSAARGLTYIGLAAFVLVYLWAIPRDLAGRYSGRLPVAVTVLAGLALAVSLLDLRSMWTVLFIAAAAGAGRLRPSLAALGGVAAMSALAAVAPIAHAAAIARPADLVRTLESSIEVALVGLVVIGFTQSQRTSQELRRAQAQVARTATELERARISRDLHDLLGHSLSMIALKTELARRLIGRDPDRAAAELAEVEDVVRTSLRDVRQAVAGYRQVTLEAELEGARIALVAAGFGVGLEHPDEPLDPATDALLGWVVREGATNIVRHSGGTHCSMLLTHDGGEVRLEILDDGPKPAAGASARASMGSGRGLRGLRERVDQAGGTMTSGWREGDGYALVVTVPDHLPDTARPGQGSEIGSAP